MKRSLVSLLLIILLSTSTCLADEEMGSYGGIEDAMKYTQGVENAFMGQKPVTDEEFNKVLEEVKAKQKKKKWFSKDKPFKGKSFNEESNGNYLGETADKNILLGVPLELINGDGAEIPTGHYKVSGKKEKNETFLDFYQSSTLVARVPAIETKYDFDEKEINFVKLLPYSEERVKIIYGSLDFNAYTFIKIKNKIRD